MGRDPVHERRTPGPAGRSSQSHEAIPDRIPGIHPSGGAPRELHRAAAGALLMRRLAAFACAWLLFLGASGARANSILSAGGLGEPQLEEAAALRALGGAGVAEHGARDISLVNPASLADVDRILLQLTVVPEFRRASSPTVTENLNETTFPSARAIIALPGRIVLGGSYVSGTNAQYTVERPENQGVPSTVRVDGSGGINFLRVSLARQVVPGFRLGADWEVIAGSYRETWLRTFSDSGLVTSRD